MARGRRRRAINTNATNTTSVHSAIASLVKKRRITESTRDTYSIFQNTNEKIQNLKSKVYSGINKCDVTGMVATGVPQMLILSQRISVLENLIQQSFSDVSEEFHTIKDGFEELKKTLPTAVSETLRENGQVEERPLQVLDIKSMEERLISIMREMLNRNENNQMLTSVSLDPDHNNNQENNEINYNLYSWGGHLHPVPISFKFPIGINTNQLWNLYFHGDSSTIPQIPPYKILKDADLNKNDLSYFCKARFVVSIIAVMAFKAGLFEIYGQNKGDDNFVLTSKEINRAISSLTFADSKTIFIKGFEDLLSIVHPLSQRNASVVYTTLYARIKKYDKSATLKLESHLKIKN